MAERLRNLLESQRQLLRDVSHELRSPLARLQIALGLARRPNANLEQEFDRIEQEAQRLDELIGEILSLSSAPRGSGLRSMVDRAGQSRRAAGDAGGERQSRGRTALGASRTAQPADRR